MISVFVLVDALGWEFVKGREFLNDILPYRKSLQTVFGFSSAAIPSILTGLPPREHGHWNLFVYSPRTSPFRWTRLLGWMPRRWLNSRVVRKGVSIVSRKLSGTRGYFQIYGVPVEILPLFDICERENIYSPRGIRPSRSIFDHLEGHGVPYRCYSYHDFTDEAAVKQCVGDIRAGSAQFYFVYLSALDHFLHHHIGQPEQVNAELKKYGSMLRGIYEAAAGAEGGASFYVFSDHGMTPTARTFDLMGAIARLGFQTPRDYVALYDSTMARFWFFQDAARDRILPHLRTLACGHLLGPEERRALGVDFEDNRFGDEIFLMDAGCLMHPSHMGRVAPAGMHGFHPDAASSSACFMASEEPPVPVERICDIFALMMREAGSR